jgi:quercetin dioxygenase-like cupin family protein
MRTQMIRHQSIGLAALATAFLDLASGAVAQQPKRTELKKVDLSGTNMEIIVSIVEVPPGAMIPRHTHKGEEAIQILEGGMIETYEQKKEMWETGATFINVRDVPHGGYKVVGDMAIKALTVHILDKGSPFSIPAK